MAPLLTQEEADIFVGGLIVVKHKVILADVQLGAIESISVDDGRIVVELDWYARQIDDTRLEPINGVYDFIVDSWHYTRESQKPLVFVSQSFGHSVEFMPQDNPGLTALAEKIGKLVSVI